jgi:hypothetical protein
LDRISLPKAAIFWFAPVASGILNVVQGSAPEEILLSETSSQNPSLHLRNFVRDHLNLQIGDEMANYVAAKVAQSSEPFAVIGHDARTGIPVRKTIDPKSLATELRS